MRDIAIKLVEEKCDLCGACIGVCPTDAIVLWEFKLEIKKDVCIECMKCVQICPCGAFRRVNVDEG